MEPKARQARGIRGMVSVSLQVLAFLIVSTPKVFADAALDSGPREDPVIVLLACLGIFLVVTVMSLVVLEKIRNEYVAR
jgi:hypothetical protein